MKRGKWFWVRVAVVGAGALSGPSVTSPRYVASSDIVWADVLLIFLLTIPALLMVLGVQTVNPYSARVWRRPSWEVNPFLFNEPLQGFHCIAYHFLALGAVACMTLVYRGARGAPLAASLLAIGAGLHIAIGLSPFFFRRKMGKSTDRVGNAAPQ